MNVQGLFRPGVSNANYAALKQTLLAKYTGHDQKIMMQRIAKANAMRASGIAPQQRKEKQTSIQTEKMGKKGAAPVGLCAAEVGEGKNPFVEPCWIDGIKQRMDPVLSNVEKGAWLCGKDALGPHQVVATEAAKLMANTPGDPGPGDRRGLMVFHNTGSGKCMAYDTPILMHDGTIKKVQDISVGDVVMGDDSGPRHVLDLGRGQEAMYTIVPSKGESWGCNESHILVLKFIRHKQVTKTPSNTFCLHWHQGNGIFKTQNFKRENDAVLFAETISDDLAIVEIELKDYLLLGSHLKHVLKMYRTGVDFVQTEEPCFDPYVLGAWLGDGTSANTGFTSADVEIINELQGRLEPYNMYVKPYAAKYQFTMTGDVNVLRDVLKARDMIQNKHIPHHIKTGTRETRLAVLAGLLDTDGYYDRNCYEITQKNKQLANDIVFVARSLGFLATTRSVEKSCMYKGEKKTGTYQRVMISGTGLEDIPVVLDRKKASPRQQIKNALHYGFKVVPAGWGNYYGFTVDDNHRYLLGDFTVSHNTVTAMGIIAAFWHTGRKIFFVTSNENSKNNPLSEYAKLALVFYPEYASVIFGKAAYLPPKKMWSVAGYKARETFKDPDGHDVTFVDWCVNIGAPIISKRLSGGKIITFWVFAGAGRADKIDKLKTEGAVLIIDESQNMYKPRSAGAESDALGYMAKHLPTEAYMKKSFIFPLTATPGDTAGQVLSMVNVVRPWGMPAVTPQQFVANPASIRGLVSYADIRGDQTHYGHLSGPDKKPINKFVTFEPRYFAALLAEMKGYNEATNLNSNPGDSKKFYIKSMVGSCILGAKKVKDMYKGDEASFEKLLAAKINGRTEVVFSSKMEAIFKAIESTKGCQYLYVPDPNVLKATVEVMQSRLGYERITSDQKYLRQVTKGSKKAWEIDSGLGEKKRFYAFYPGTMDGTPGDADQMKAVLDFFKSSKNKYGERIKLFVGTVFEGLDMGWLQAVHLASPLPSTADDDQAVGRALRYCGHDPFAREVAVYRYFGIAPKTLDGVNAKPAKQKSIDMGLEALANKDERGVNMHVYQDALRRGKPMKDFMMCIRGQSIECEANGNNGGILAAVQYGEKTRCGVQRCDVKLNAKGDLIVEEHAPGKHANKITHAPKKLGGFFGGPGKKSVGIAHASGVGKPAGHVGKPAGHVGKPAVKTSGSRPVKNASGPSAYNQLHQYTTTQVHRTNHAHHATTPVHRTNHAHHATTPVHRTLARHGTTAKYAQRPEARILAYPQPPRAGAPAAGKTQYSGSGSGMGGWLTRLFGSAPTRPQKGGSWVGF